MTARLARSAAAESRHEQLSLAIGPAIACPITLLGGVVIMRSQVPCTTSRPG